MTRAPHSLRDPLPGALLIAAVAALLCLWRAWCEFPIYSWNEARVAPAFALRQGINPYPQLEGGPVSTWIYGPSGIVINLPATFASSALGALQVASLINFIVLILPLAWVLFHSPGLQAKGPTARWFALAIAVLLIPRPNLVLQVADHTAIAFGIISCWFLVRIPRPTQADLAVAAGSALLAAWAKQIEVFLVAAQFAYFLLGRDRSMAVRYFLWLAGLGFLSLGVTVGYFGWSNLWLNLVAIPGRLPWVGDFTDRIAMRPWALVAQIVVPCVALAWLRASRHWPRRDTLNDRFFLITIFAYIVMLPVGLAGFFKIGGDTNLFHSWDYLLPAALLAWLGTDKIPQKVGFWSVVGVTFFCLILRWSDIVSVPSGPFASHFDSAEKIMAVHPHRIWFPRNPLITFYADGRLWHSEDGVQTRFLANYGIKQADFRRYLPPDLEGMAYPSIITFPFSKPLLMEFNRSTKYPFWTLHTREESTAHSP